MEEALHWNQILRRERKIHGWAQKDVARNIDCDSKNIGRWERGEAFPSPYYQQQLMKIYGKSAEELGFMVNNRASDIITPHSPLQETRSINMRWMNHDPRKQVDWGTAPNIEGFCGREQEQAVVEQWLTMDDCRIIAVLGIGGIGKTTFTTKLARNMYQMFDCTCWRSLHNAPSLETLLKSCLTSLSLHEPITLPEDETELTTMLIEVLQERRCLLIFDNVESLFQARQHSGTYHNGYEGYSRLFQRLGETAHRSCLLLTSREKPKEIAHMEGKTVKSFSLAGLKLSESQQLLQGRQLSGSDEAWIRLIQLYDGNPLALKIASELVQNVFQGDIAAFLNENEIIVSDISHLLNQQFYRLSSLEQEVMYWLAIERHAISLSELQADIVRPIARGMLLNACNSLRTRSLIELQNNAFTLQPVIIQYVTERFVEHIYQEIEAERLEFLNLHALLKADRDDHIRENQTHSILAPIAERLLSTYVKTHVAK